MKLKLYRWQGRNRLQQKQRGLIVAESPIRAQQELFSRGLQNLKLQQEWQFSVKPNNALLCDLLMQLATLLQAAVPLKQCLQILRQGCTNIALSRWLQSLLADIESGLPFSQALERQEPYLNLQEQQLIKTGEMTGRLAYVCDRIAVHRRQVLALQRKVRKILLYPGLVLGISSVLTVLLLLFIVPQFAEMYADNQASLPLFTRMLLSLSDGLRHYFWQAALLIGLSIVLIRLQLQRSARLVRLKIRLFSALPVMGQILKLSRLIGFCRSLQLMLQAGVPLNQALQSFLPQLKSWQTALKRQGDPILIEEVRSMLHWIGQGYGFSASVGAELFPLQAQQMLSVGEQAGQLGAMLQHIADTYQQRLDYQTDLLSQMLEPLLMVIIGGLIGLIMLGMYLPIFNMGSMIQ